MVRPAPGARTRHHRGRLQHALRARGLRPIAGAGAPGHQGAGRHGRHRALPRGRWHDRAEVRDALLPPSRRWSLRRVIMDVHDRGRRPAPLHRFDLEALRQVIGTCPACAVTRRGTLGATVDEALGHTTGVVYRRSRKSVTMRCQFCGLQWTTTWVNVSQAMTCPRGTVTVRCPTSWPTSRSSRSADLFVCHPTGTASEIGVVCVEPGLVGRALRGACVRQGLPRLARVLPRLAVSRALPRASCGPQVRVQ